MMLRIGAAKGGKGKVYLPRSITTGDRLLRASYTAKELGRSEVRRPIAKCRMNIHIAAPRGAGL